MSSSEKHHSDSPNDKGNNADAEKNIYNEKSITSVENYTNSNSNDDVKIKSEYFYNFLRFPGTKQSLASGIITGTFTGIYGFRKHS